MNEMMVDIGPESQTIALHLNTYDTFAYIVTTFAVNGYEVKITEHITDAGTHKTMTGVVKNDGWFIRLIVSGVPLTEGEAQAATEIDDSGRTTGGSAVRDEQEGPVYGGGVSHRPRRRAKKSPVLQPAGA